MEVRGSRYDLHAARDALTNARSLIHGFALHPVAAAVDEGVKVTIEVERHADDALEEHRSRRIWLVLSVIPITLVIFLLLMYAKHLPPPGDAAG